MNFKKLFESMDSSFPIVNQDKIGNTKRYYLNVNKDKYRIFVENDENDLHVGFEYFDDNTWDIDSVRNTLSPKEIFGIFGTLKNILKTQKIKSIFIKTSDKKKAQTYYNAIRKLNDCFKFEHIYRDDKAILAINGKREYKPAFKYKFK